VNFVHAISFKPHGAMTRREQRNALADQDRNYMNDEFVDLAFIEKRRNDAGASHHPDVLSFFRPPSGCEGFDWFVHKLHAGGRGRFHPSAVKT
jgi:hypothetical protein